MPGVKRSLTDQDRKKMEQWIKAKRSKDYQQADILRDELRLRGIAGRASRRLAAMRPAPGHRRRSRFEQDVGLDLGLVLEQWVTAKRHGDIDSAEAAHAQLHQFGVDPHAVWPDADVPWEKIDIVSRRHLSTQDKTDAPEIHEDQLSPSRTEDHVGAVHVDADEDTSINAKGVDGKVDADVDAVSPEPLAEGPSADEFCVATNLADVYYAVEDEPVVKAKNRAVAFTPELLAAAPPSVQTCDGILTFLRRKLSDPFPAPPGVSGPAHLHSKLIYYADRAGRLASLQSSDGWDRRATRALDICSFAAIPVGQEMLKDRRAKLEEQMRQLTQLFEQRGHETPGESLEELTQERQKWASLCARRDWLLWCAHLLIARRGMLFSAAGKENEPHNRKHSSTGCIATMSDVFESLLSGKNCPSMDLLNAV